MKTTRVTIFLFLFSSLLLPNFAVATPQTKYSITSKNPITEDYKTEINDSVNQGDSNHKSINLVQIIKKNPALIGFIIIIIGSFVTLILILIAYLFYRLRKGKKK